jgi:hypothetical protein
MLTSHELFGFMSPALSQEILEHTFADDKDMYRATLAAIAQAGKVRPVFLERQPRAQRHPSMIAALSRPGLDLIASNLLRSWLLKKHSAVLIDYLDALGVPHKNGVVENLPDTVEDAKLNAAIDGLLAKHPREVVTVYLHAFNSMNDTRWANLDAMLKNDARLQF